MVTGFCNSIILFSGIFLLAGNLVCAQKGIRVNDQVWMRKNLNVSTFRNGDPVPEARTKEEWLNAGSKGQPAWCYFDNMKENGKKYGKLYNWYAVNDPRGLAPKGWRIPTDADWRKLSDFMDIQNLSAKVKNPFILSLSKGGERTPNGAFEYFGKLGFWWSATSYISGESWYRNLSDSDYNVHANYTNMTQGLSIRCIKEK